jgi:HAD superfamily hydrolase (TIGR01549 family)
MTDPIANRRSGARALLFDFGGTLDAEGVPWKDRFFRLAREEGLELPQEEFDRAFYGATDSLEGTIPRSAGFRETVERVAGGLAARLRREDALLRKIGDRFAEESLGQLAQSAALLARLRERYRIGIVSNFYGNLQAVCEEAGLTPSIGVAVDSTLVGCKKPDPRIFQAALDSLKSAPSETVFVGDSMRRDMAGARAMGMRHVWLRPKGAANGGGVAACCSEDAVIARLSELSRLDL